MNLPHVQHPDKGNIVAVYSDLAGAYLDIWQPTTLSHLKWYGVRNGSNKEKMDAQHFVQ